MNVSMGDTFNLGWKLISVLTGRSPANLLHSYTAERRAAAKALVEFDHRWSRVLGTRSDDDDDAAGPRFQREFIANGPFTAGLTIQYKHSALTGLGTWQDLAIGFPIGMRFHSAPVIRLADAKPMQLGHAVEADARWRIFAFAGASDRGQANGAIDALCQFLETSPTSPVRCHTPRGTDVDTIIDFRAVFQQSFRDLDYGAMPPLLRPHKGAHGLCDYEKIFCADLRNGDDIFTMRGIDRGQGCIVVVRPDQHVANVVPIDAYSEVSSFFAGFMIDQTPPR